MERIEMCHASYEEGYEEGYEAGIRAASKILVRQSRYDYRMGQAAKEMDYLVMDPELLCNHFARGMAQAGTEIRKLLK